ncbi:hypothetical protein [Staphylococcus simiae]|uniref:Uncharacterized protein n=1 Tax=Staphylococcus simiae CCM 7213 = CCUG 51256 TaxID=911238 RepID=G5JJX4_9STAP|nr:hypothetical protein [Staphylococcus simiae]EHJ07529.1 hypothetical protein SS7213T_08927 [Staphylococcus simiae CCM 7213 = CCUG 51256]SNV75280.1 membrane protein [Staphylococcus simiae]
MKDKNKIIAIVATIISFLVMALPIIWYTATVLWFLPGAVIIIIVMFLLLFLYFKTKNDIHLLLLLVNIIILLFYCIPLLLS